MSKLISGIQHFKLEFRILFIEVWNKKFRKLKIWIVVIFIVVVLKFAICVVKIEQWDLIVDFTGLFAVIINIKRVTVNSELESA